MPSGIKSTITHCIAPGCGKRENVPLSRGLCKKHYYRLRKHGDPSISLVARHGQKWPIETPEYVAWKNMKQRVFNVNRSDWKRYGGRGITMFPEWVKSFQSFYDHVGAKPTARHTLDRIDNSKGYEPGNVRWATQITQARNTRTNLFITIDGETKPLSQWVQERSSVSYGTVYTRLALGWEPLAALTTPRVHKSRLSKDL